MKKKILIGIGTVLLVFIGLIIRGKIVNAEVTKKIIFEKLNDYEEVIDNSLDKEELEKALEKLGYKINLMPSNNDSSYDSKILTIKSDQVTSNIPSVEERFNDDYNGPEAGTWLMTSVMDNPFSRINASSVLESQGSNTYETTNLSDDNPQTAWVEGKDDYGIGEYIELIEGGLKIIIYNGYQKSDKSFYDNSRVKKFKVYFDDTHVGFVELADSPGKQFFNLEELPYENDHPKTIKLEIIEVYEGKKWSDTAISQIFYSGG